MVSRVILVLLVCAVPMQAQRYLTQVFSSTSKTANVQYGSALNVKGQQEALMLDLYQPQGDTAQARPLVIFVHGGGFVGGDKGTPQFVQLCTDFAKRGYVTASINYRLDTVTVSRAVMNAMHDARAAVRYFRRNTSQYRLDTTRIAMGGGSAGAYTSLCVAYVNRVAEVYPASGTQSVEGNSGNPGYSSTIHACLDYWGALQDVDAIESADDPPLLIFHGTEDQTVPFVNAVQLQARAVALGLPHEYHPLQGEGHSPWGYIDSIISTTARFLYRSLFSPATGGVTDGAAPQGLHIGQNYPNPILDGSTVPVTLAQLSRVRITLHSILGGEVAEFFNGTLAAGQHHIAIQRGSIPPGLYILRLSAAGAASRRAVVLQ